MIAGQAVAMHHASMECFRRAMISGQHPEAASKLRRDGANLARGMTDMLAALDRKRGKGPQVVRVERVIVHEGGKPSSAVCRERHSADCATPCD